MNRIETIFAELRRENRKALMPFVTAGYPSMAATQAILPAMQAGGASICEVGFAFSDPIADGPVISASMTDALAAGATPDGVFDTLQALRDRVSIGLVAMVSYSIVHRMGVDVFIARAKAAGVEGFIFPDLPLEESEAVAGPVRDAGLTSSLLVAPTSSPQRARQIAAACSGFVYAVARTGITGESEAAPQGLAERVALLREATDLPIAVGFGISRPEHVAAVVEHADAAIVGSALVRQISQVRDQPPAQIAAHVQRFIAELCQGLG